MRKSLALLFFLLGCVLITVDVRAQSLFDGFEHLFTPPRSYVAPYHAGGFVIDGLIDDAEWSDVPWTDAFVDIEGSLKPSPRYNTRAKIAWDNKFLYVAAELQEPHVWANLRQRDAIVYHDNDFEVFINPNNSTHQYFEIEVNALNTVFDLFMNRPYRNGAGALISWNTPGLKSAVKVYGTLNNGKDTDRAWTVEMAIPFSALTIGNVAHIPADGELWRINFSRVEWDTEIYAGKYQKSKDSSGKLLPENNWVWSPQGVVNMHYPERWGYLQFAKDSSRKFSLPYSELQKRVLWLIYYKQHIYYQKNKRYASKLADLGIPDQLDIENQTNQIQLRPQIKQFTATISLADGSSRCWINDQGYVEQTSK